jgi:CHAT domain-containing protein
MKSSGGAAMCLIAFKTFINFFKFILVSSIFIASGCTVALSPLLTKTEKLYTSGNYEEIVRYSKNDESKLTEREKRRILNENINKIKNHQYTSNELIYYQYDSRRLIEAYIELGQFDKALKICDEALKEWTMLGELFNKYRYPLQTNIELNKETINYLMRLKGYITWFRTGNEKDTLIYFNKALKSSEFKGDNISFLDFGGKQSISVLMEAGFLYDKMFGNYRESLNYFKQTIILAEKLSIFDIDGKYFHMLFGYKRMINLYMKLGELEEAKKTLDKYRESTNTLVFNTGHLVTSKMELFRGLVSNFDSNIGSLFALLHDFDNSKKYFDKSLIIINDIAPDSQNMRDKKALGTYYVLYGRYYFGLKNKYEEALQNIDKGITYLKPHYLDDIRDELDIETAYIYSSELHFITHNYEKAIQQAEMASKHAQRYHNKVADSTAHTLLGQIYYEKKEIKAAKKSYEKALELVKNIESTENWKLFYGLGKVNEDLNNQDKALHYYKRAVEEVEKLWNGRFKDTAKQVSFIDNRLIVFEPIIRILAKQGKDDEAIKYMEMSKSRTFYETSPYYAAKIAINSKDENIINPSIIRNIREHIPDNTAILEYYLGEDSVLAAMITKKRVYIKELQKREPKESELKLKQEVIALKLAIEDEDRKYPYKERALKLYSILIEPFVEYLDAYDSICIIPHGVLHYLPFHSLIIDEIKPSFLIDKYKIFYAPSLTILNSSYKSDHRKKTRLLAIGNSLGVDIKDLNAEKDFLDNLEYVKDEVTQVGELFNNSNKTILMDNEATETLVKNSINNFDMILFSTHGILLGKDPLKSCIFLSKDNENNGRLTISEIEEMNMETNLVILSACQTGRVNTYEGIGSDENDYTAKFPHGDDLVGLQRAFMKAGASSVLSTLWNVNDKATKSLVVDFFKNYKSGNDKISALQAAELAIKSKKGWEHPYFWASFVLSGDWR